MAAREQHGTNFKLGTDKHENFQSDYRSNYPERPIDPSGQERSQLDYLREKLRKTNLELDQFYPGENQQNTIYQEDFVQKQGGADAGQDMPNLQKTNFHLGSLEPKQQKEMYVSETKHGFVEKDLSKARVDPIQSQSQPQRGGKHIHIGLR